MILVVNLECRFTLLVFVEPDEATSSEERHETEDNVGKHGRGGAVDCGVAVPGRVRRVIDWLALVLIY